MNQEIKYKGIKLITLILCVLLTTNFFISAQAESNHYISPRLQLGLHTKATLDSPIKILISSGMAVEVLKTDKEFSKIKTPKGAEGWVKSKFLTEEEPAELKVKKMQEALKRAQDSLKQRLENKDEKLDCPAVETTVCPEVADTATDTSTDIQAFDKERAGYKETISNLKEELKAWEQLDRQDKLAQKEQAEKNNRVLKEKLAMIASVAIGEDVDASRFDLSVRGELPEIQSNPNQTLIMILKKNYLLVLMVAGLSFLLGIFIMDLVNRKRHGGYRI